MSKTKKGNPTHLKYDEEKQLWVKLYDKMTKQQLIEELKIRDHISRERMKRDAKADEYWTKSVQTKERELRRQVSCLIGVVEIMKSLNKVGLSADAVEVLRFSAASAYDDWAYGGFEEGDSSEDPYNGVGQLKDEVEKVWS